MQAGPKKRRARARRGRGAQLTNPEAEPQAAPKIEVVDHERDARLLRDDSAWERIGRELRICDPKRYVALLKVAEDICSIHRDPLGAPVPSGYLMFAPRDPDQFD